MKIRILLLLTLILAFSFAACQKAPAPATPGTQSPAVQQPAQTQAPVQGTAPVQPAQSQGTQQPYPGPQSQLQAETAAVTSNSPYPGPEGAEKVDWAKAQEIIKSGIVMQVVQNHELQVIIITKDNKSYVTTEPALDDVMKVIQACGDKCISIVRMTE